MAYRLAPKHFHGWKEDGKFYLSIEPRGFAKNEYDTPLEAVAEASKRGRSVKWEKPEEVA